MHGLLPSEDKSSLTVRSSYLDDIDVPPAGFEEINQPQ